MPPLVIHLRTILETIDPVIAKPYSPENICAVGDIEGRNN